MEIGLTLRPGMSGTKKLLARYGERLVCLAIDTTERPGDASRPQS
jgi:hypothetical protein